MKSALESTDLSLELVDSSIDFIANPGKVSVLYSLSADYHEINATID